MARDLERELEEGHSAIRRRLGRLGRDVKRIELRERIVANPFTAIGVAAGIGAIVGFARPMPRRGPISGALIGAITAVGIRFVRGYAMQQLGTMAKNVVLNRRDDEGQRRDLGPRGVASGSGIRYTPTR